MSSEDYLSILASHNNRGKLKFDRSFDCTQSWFFQVLEFKTLFDFSGYTVGFNVPFTIGDSKMDGPFSRVGKKPAYAQITNLLCGTLQSS